MESAKALYEKSSESGNFQAEERLKRLQTKSMLPESMLYYFVLYFNA